MTQVVNEDASTKLCSIQNKCNCMVKHVFSSFYLAMYIN